MLNRVYPDLEWYSARSAERNLPIRCPHANVHACPRYYQSLSLLGGAGITTRIDAKTDAELVARWKATPLWPVVAEHATSVGNNSHFANFCPEVSFDTFRLFASYLARYADEIDKRAAEQWLTATGVSAWEKEWGWDWQSVTEMHFSECPLYSQLPHTRASAPAPKSEEIVSVKPGAFGVSVDVKRLLSRLARWWLERNARGG
jgi:hypothetical protein